MFVHIRFIFLLANHHRGRRRKGSGKTQSSLRGRRRAEPEEAVTEQKPFLVLKCVCVKECACVCVCVCDCGSLFSNKPAHSCQVPAKAVLCFILLAKDSQINFSMLCWEGAWLWRSLWPSAVPRSTSGIETWLLPTVPWCVLGSRPCCSMRPSRPSSLRFLALHPQEKLHLGEIQFDQALSQSGPPLAGIPFGKHVFKLYVKGTLT